MASDPDRITTPEDVDAERRTEGLDGNRGEVKRVSKKRIVIAVIALAVLIFLANGVRRWLSFDRCLDAGGAWDYRSEDCRY